LDPCHAPAAGLGLDGLVDRVKAITGRVDVVHCNDSRDDEFSGADRHANLGEGFVDADALVALVRAADTWTILETPGGVPEHERDLAWLRERIPQR
ncbi:MAG TPA: TIM barrel protein, partial [Arachnia sp.]|nr:TIM barrel protein [Arachnia sp.]